MKSIDTYIYHSQFLPNVSVGGSECYAFGDVVLVKYKMSAKYGIVRENEEQVASLANQANAKGVNTPKHIAIKREEVDGQNICWVLQEKAKGVSFANYSWNRDNQVQLASQKVFADAPIEHYTKLVSDLMYLFNAGLELKPKNVFYDEDKKNGGFVIIDLLGGNQKPFSGSLEDVIMMQRLVNFVTNFTSIPSYNNPTEQQAQMSKIYENKIKAKIFMAMEKSIPNFEEHKRWLLRTFDQQTLFGLEQNGIDVGDLTLTTQEKQKFVQMLNESVDSLVEKIKSGKYTYHDIVANQVRFVTSDKGLAYSWGYHDQCPYSRQDFSDDYEFKWKLESDIQSKLMAKVNQKIKELVSDPQTATPEVVSAYQEMSQNEYLY